MHPCGSVPWLYICAAVMDQLGRGAPLWRQAQQPALQVMLRQRSPEADKHSCNHKLCSLLNPFCQVHKIALPGRCEAAPLARQWPCEPAAEAAESALLPGPRQAAGVPACAAHARPLQRLQTAQGRLQEEQKLASDLRLIAIQWPCEQVSVYNTHKTYSAGSQAGGDLQR